MMRTPFGMALSFTLFVGCSGSSAASRPTDDAKPLTTPPISVVFDVLCDGVADQRMEGGTLTLGSWMQLGLPSSGDPEENRCTLRCVANRSP